MSGTAVVLEVPGLEEIRAALDRVERRQAEQERQLSEIAAALVAPVSVDEYARRRAISRATAWRRIRRGDVPVIHEGGRTLVPVAALRGPDEAEVVAIAARGRR